jgi:heme-degrading monooxygenase HmoA
VIARTWRGETATADADAYVSYLEATGIKEYRATPGNLGAMVLRRSLGETTEFITFSLWESLDAVRAFAGDDPERAVFYPEDDRYLVARDLTVDHFEVAIRA